MEFLTNGDNAQMQKTFKKNRGKTSKVKMSNHLVGIYSAQMYFIFLVIASVISLNFI